MTDNKENVLIRFANVDELDKVRDFIAKEWNLTREYYEQFHLCFDKLWIVVGVGEETNDIYGTAGLILTSNKANEVQVVLLLVDQEKIKSAIDFSGIVLINHVLNNMGFETSSSCGVRKKTLPIYKWLGCITGKMNHYYRLGDRSEYKVAVVEDKKIVPWEKGTMTLRRLETPEDLECFDYEKYKDRKPYKDVWCIKHRYFDEKKHSYEVYGVENGDGVVDALLVIRELEREGGRFCKIVDYVGDDRAFAGLGDEFDRLIKERGYEFIDFYSVGMDEKDIKAAGFVVLEAESSNIIPHFTEPLVKENKDIYYFIDKCEDMHLFIGDCDQDRSVEGYMI